MSKPDRTKPDTNSDVIHFALCDFGRHGPSWVEMAPGMTEAKLVEEIVTGQMDNHITQVIAINIKAGTSVDVTNQIGALVFYHYDAQDEMRHGVSAAERSLCLRAGFDLDEAFPIARQAAE